MKRKTISIVLALIIALTLTTAVYADATCNPKANPNSSSYQACTPEELAAAEDDDKENSGLHVGQLAQEAGVPASQLVQAAHDTGVQGLGTDKEETQLVISSYIASLPTADPAPSANNGNWQNVRGHDPLYWTMMYKPMPKPWATGTYMRLWINNNSLEQRVLAQGLLTSNQLAEGAVILGHPRRGGKK